MPAVVVALPAASPRTLKARFVDAAGTEWVFPHAPLDVEHSGKASTIAIDPRPDRLPLVERSGQSVPLCKIRWKLSRRFADQPIENSLSRLQALLGDGRLIRFDYGPGETGWWICDNLSWRVTERTETNDAHTAEVAVDLVRAVDALTASVVDQVRSPIHQINF